MAIPYLTQTSISQDDWDYALDLVSEWQSYPAVEGLPGDIGKLARAFAHLKRCYDEEMAFKSGDSHG